MTDAIFAFILQLTNSSLVQNLQFVAIAGPTYDQVTPFQWSKSDFKNTVSHIGHPDLFQFGPYIFGDNVTKFEWMRKFVKDIVYCFYYKRKNYFITYL